MRRSRIFNQVVILLLSLAVFPAAAPTAVSPTAFASELDPVSAACLFCHDGSGGPHVKFCLLSQKGKGCGGHIVSASYATLAARKRDLHPESSLPPQLALYEGKITCATCHGNDPHYGEMLAMDNSNSELCRGCHLK